MATFEFVPATEEHARGFELRPGDAREAHAWMGDFANEACLYCVRNSTVAWAWLVDGKPAALFGVRAVDFVSGHGEVWMASSALVEQHPIAFLRASKRAVAELRARFNHMENWCDGRYEKSLAWLRWMGFTVSGAVPTPYCQTPFCKFWMKG